MRYFLVFLVVFLFFRLTLFYFLSFPLTAGQHVSFSAPLLDDPKISGSSQKFSLRFGDFWHSMNIQIETNTDQEFSYGQTLMVSGTLENIVLKNKQVILAIQSPKIEAKNSGFLPYFGILRAKIIDFCENNFSQPYSGLLVGIIFGIKSLLTPQTTTSFRITGLSHIVAASGMNVTLVAGFLIGLLGSFLKRKTAIFVSLIGIFIYVCLSGFQASIIRAALMGGIAFSASLFGRQYSGVYILFLVGIGMLLWDPLLLTDVGFQLSILATAGILLLKPSLFGIHFLSDDFGTTLAAQIATLPVLLATFGQYSLLSIAANLLVLWTIPLITVIGGIGIIVGLFFEPIGRFITAISIPLLWYLNWTTSFFSSHTVQVQISSLPILFIAGYYILVFALIFSFQKSKKEKELLIDRR